MKYVVSDIHGNRDAWDSILSQINLKKDDTLYVLGDVIDRGPSGIDILQEIIHTPNMEMLMGNHEYMMMEALDFPYYENDPEMCNTQTQRMNLWFYNGGQITYSRWKLLSEDEREEIKNYLKSLPFNIETEANGRKYVLGHANWGKMFDVLNEYESDDNNIRRASFCIWDRRYLFMCSKYLPDNTKMVFGHTPTIKYLAKWEKYINIGKHLDILRLNNMIDIDCGAGLQDPEITGCLGCLCLDNLHEYYSR